MKNVDQLVEETMASLDGLEPVRANPFLYTRISQRMKDRYQQRSSGRLMPVLAAALVLFICVNLLSIAELASTASGKAQEKGSNIDGFAAEYQLQDDGGILN